MKLCRGLMILKKRLLIGLTIAALSVPAKPALAGSLGDFFKALGNSIAHPGQHRTRSRLRRPEQACQDERIGAKSSQLSSGAYTCANATTDSHAYGNSKPALRFVQLRRHRRTRTRSVIFLTLSRSGETRFCYEPLLT